jgi:hypothetical protein
MYKIYDHKEKTFFTIKNDDIYEYLCLGTFILGKCQGYTEFFKHEDYPNCIHVSYLNSKILSIIDPEKQVYELGIDMLIQYKYKFNTIVDYLQYININTEKLKYFLKKSFYNPSILNFVKGNPKLYLISLKCGIGHELDIIGRQHHYNFQMYPKYNFYIPNKQNIEISILNDIRARYIKTTYHKLKFKNMCNFKFILPKIRKFW